MKIWLEVKSVIGELFVSKSEEINSQQMQALIKLIKNIKSMDTFCLETPECEVYFNPAHIVTIKLCKQGE